MIKELEVANIIPDEVVAFQTEGEERFYKFLRQVAKPDGRYLGWYLPDINGREPDFLVFSKDVGLVIFEVKDWVIDQICEATPQYFILNVAGHQERRKNPIFQAKEYFSYVLEKLTKDGRLLSREPEYYGKVRIPISYGAVFPNINKFEYQDKKLGNVVPVEKTFFWDDLHTSSDICVDKSGRAFSEALKEMFNPAFQFQVTGKDLEILRNVIFPIVRIEAPNRGKDVDPDAQQARIKQLDHNQEAIARQLGGGHRIVTGPSGSGKTLVLVHRAALLLNYTPEVKRILFVCYNLTLSNYIQRLVSEKGLPLGDAGVDVVPFYQLCSRLIGESVPNDGQDKDYYELITSVALEKVESCDWRYDAVLVDEGQDFSDNMLKVCMGLLQPGSDHLMIAMDKEQRIYRRRASWKELGIEAKGRVHSLNWVYRNSDEIAQFAARFMGHAGCNEKGVVQHELLPNLFGHHGPEPIMSQYEGYSSLGECVVQRVSGWIGKGYPASEIAILYTTKTPKDLGEGYLPDSLKRELGRRGVLSQWVSETAQAKEAYDVTTNKVTISTVHSVKGLDYACVVLIGVEHLDIDRTGKEQARNLVYVAMTRARMELEIMWTEKTKLIDRLEKALKL